MLLRSALPSQKNKHFSFTTAYVFSSPFHGSESCLKREGECGWSYNFFMVHFALLSSPKSLPKARLNSDITTQTHSHTCSILYTCTCRGVPTAMCLDIPFLSCCSEVGNVGLSVRYEYSSIALWCLWVQGEISQQLLDYLPLHLVHAFKRVMTKDLAVPHIQRYISVSI